MSNLPHVSTREYEWYTPQEYVDAVHEVMGGIDLDPASCEEANSVVRAACYFDKEMDGLRCNWWGRVFLNPPYCMPDVELFTARCKRAYEKHEIEQAIILTNNSSETGWFHNLLDYPFCLPWTRIRFWQPGRASSYPRQGQAFFYLGPDTERWTRVFGRFGAVCSTITRYQFPMIFSGSSTSDFPVGELKAKWVT